jgi:hypothetical protein
MKKNNARIKKFMTDVFLVKKGAPAKRGLLLHCSFNIEAVM